MMAILDLLAGPVIGVVGKIIDKIFPDPAQREAAKLELLRQQQAGELEELKTSLSAILAEAQSSDPWTSRARPSFLYIIYIFILASIPMGILFALNGAMAANITTGVQGWLAAIPESLWWLFGAGYLGYSGARSFDKWKGPK